MSIKTHQYYIYILTNSRKTSVYTGVTNDLSVRLLQHWENRKNKKSFTGKYQCFNLVYFEVFDDINDAISREKEIKGWTRSRKNALIETTNPEWIFLNDLFYSQWPPIEMRKRN
jgi:putative endonuclease